MTVRELFNEWARLPARYANVEQLRRLDVLEAPHMGMGRVEQFEMARERWGFAYLEVSSSDAEAVAPGMEKRKGR